MRLFLTISLMTLSVMVSAQRNQKKLESSFDFGAGNHFGLRQIESGFNVNSLTLSNYTLGWTNYFTNNKFGGRLEFSYDRMVNNTNSSPFQTNYFRATYYLNTSLKNLIGWGISKKPVIDKKSFIQSFDIDLAAGIGYSAMTNKQATITVSPFLRKADDMLNISFRISPSLEIADGLKLFASYTRINHSAQSNSFDFTESITNTAFRGAFRTLNVGIRYTPQTSRVYSRALKERNKNLHFITSLDLSFGNHFAGKTNNTSATINSLGINHFNIGAQHKYPNSKLSGRFDIGYDVFSARKNDPNYSTKYFRTTYQVIADLGSLSPYQGNENRFNLALGSGIGFSTMYNSQSKDNFSDKFLIGDDMYVLLFSIIPTYKINNSFSLVSNLTLVSHSLQSNSWDLRESQINSAFNGRLMNFSVGLRYHLNERMWNTNAELENKIEKNLTVDASIGNHFGGRAQGSNQNLNSAIGRHFAIGLIHPYHNPVYFGRFEFAKDKLGSGNNGDINYYRGTYYMMTSLKNQLKQNDQFEEKNSKTDLQFGLGVGASMLKSTESNDTFISKGDDMLNLCLRVAPTYKINDNISAFAAYTWTSHSLQSMYFDESQSIDKTMFNGRLMNASLGITYTVIKSKPRRSFVEVAPIKNVSEAKNVEKEQSHTISVVSDSSQVVINEAVIEPEQIQVETIVGEKGELNPTNTGKKDVTPISSNTTSNSSENVKQSESNSISEKSESQEKNDQILSTTSYTPVGEYPVNTSVITESQKQSLKDLAFQLKQNKFLSLQLTGYTDNIGSAEYNLSLSRKRAALVKEYLMSQGISGDRIRIDYKGIENPVASNSTTEGRTKNRRVEIEIIKHSVPYGN